MWNTKGPSRLYLYLRFWRHVAAPRTAMMMPVWVSPIFMVDVSTAAIVVSW